jgi:hypothetical protein
MKLILSRKGFDAGYGGVASPILPSGELLSLPIPYKDPLRTYRTVHFNGQPLARLVRSLTKGKIGPHQTCHLDPDLRYDSVHRAAGWMPMFGQVGAAQTHLCKQGVGIGDLFLFFGWFRQTQYRGGQLLFATGAKDVHMLYGWLQVGAVHQPTGEFLDDHPWAGEHPHCLDNGWGTNNRIYLAALSLRLNGHDTGLAGGGVFPQYTETLRLTAPGRTRSIWRLPGWMHPAGKSSTLSYHGDPMIWQKDGACTLLASRRKGQEFVLQAEDYPGAVGWLEGLFKEVG